MRRYESLAWKELLAQRVVSCLILLAVVLSTMMTAAIAQSAGVLSAMRQQQAIAIGGDRHAGFVQMDEAQLAALRGDPRLSLVSPYIVAGNTVLDNTLNLGLSEFYGDVTAVYPAISAVKEGRLPQAPFEIALPEDALTYLGFSGQVGDTLTLSLSKALRHGVMARSFDYTADFTLVGITRSSYLNYAAGVIQGIVGPGTAEAALPAEYFYYNVDVKMKEPGRFQAVMDDLTQSLDIPELDTLYNTPYLDALGIRYSKTSADVAVSDGGFPFMLAAGATVGILLLLAAGLVIYNVEKIAVTRRLRQYGVLRAMGAGRGQLCFLVSAQVLMLCAVGIPVGLLLGMASAQGILTAATGLLSPSIFMVRDSGELARLIGENSAGKGWFLLAGAALTLCFALGAALPAARYASRVSPTVAMEGSPARIKRRGRGAKRIRSFEAFYARLNLKRNPGRTAITILSLVMSITVFIALQGAVDLLDAAAEKAGEHWGDYSIVNETVGFSPAEYQTMAEDPRVAELTAMQFSCYEQGSDGRPVGIALDRPLRPAETFQVVGLNAACWDRAFPDLPPETRESLKAGEGCVIRNPLAMVYEGQEIPHTNIRTGERITVAGRELMVLNTMDGYDGYLTPGNSGFVNGVQVIVNEELYAALTGKTAYAELLPTLAKDVDRGEFDGVVEALAGRVPGSVWLSYENTDRQLAESFEQTRLLAWGLIALIGLIGLLNIVNTVYTNIHTRAGEIGIQRAIGMSAESLYKTFLWEGAYYALIASVLGGVVGYACAVLTSAAATQTLGLVAPPLLPTLEAALLSLCACLLATCIPLGRIRKTSVVEALDEAE